MVDDAIVAETDSQNGGQKPGLDDILEQLPPAVRESILRAPKEQRSILIAQARLVSSSYRGPIPPPESLAKYEQVLPGSAERILAMAERQSAHRIYLESIAIPGQINQSRNGQIFGLIIGALGLGVALWLGLTGHDWLAGTIATSDLGGLAIAFIVGKKKQAKDLNEKAK